VGITLGLLISLIIVFWVGFATWLILIGVAFGSSLLLATWFARRLAGLSGDAYGAIIEITEALLLIIVASS
jgi:adenosylcobinamide-GDP ribazoletransferase